MIITTARLIGGPFDGKVDQGVIVDKLPELATWAHCWECKREHLHSVDLGVDRSPDVPVYMRDPDSSEVLVLYRWHDLDEELDDLLCEVAMFEPVTAAGRAARERAIAGPAMIARVEQLASPLPLHPNCFCVIEPLDT